MRRSAFLSKKSLRTFVLKYTFYLVFLMSVQCLEVVIIIIGSLNEGYFNPLIYDGFHEYRYWYLIGDQISFTALCFTTLIEPVFKSTLWNIYFKRIRPIFCFKRQKRSMAQKDGNRSRSNDSRSKSQPIGIDGQPLLDINHENNNNGSIKANN